jgi:cysteine desulfuration protein SufE
MAHMPEKLKHVLDELDGLGADERADYLVEFSNEFQDVPARVAERPFPDEHRVPKCESEAYVWAEDRADGTLDFHYAVENRHGISARAVATLLKDTLSREPLEDVAAVSPEIVSRIFGRQLSMGKGEGLTGIVEMTVAEAKKRLKDRA